MTAHPLCLNLFNASPYLGAGVALEDQLDAAAKAGFGLVGIDLFSLRRYVAQGGTAEALAHRLEDLGVACASVTAAGVIGAGPQTLEDVAFAAGWAAALQANFLQVNGGLEPGPAAAAALEQLWERTAIEAPNLRLAIEYLPFSPLDSLEGAVALARHVGFDRAGVLIDVWHHERGRDDWDVLAAVPVEAIAYVEFDDGLAPLGDDAVLETLSRRTFPGQGVFALERFASAIRDIGYQGMVSVEVLNASWRDGDFLEFARRCHATSRPYWS